MGLPAFPAFGHPHQAGVEQIDAVSIVDAAGFGPAGTDHGLHRRAGRFDPFRRNSDCAFDDDHESVSLSSGVAAPSSSGAVASAGGFSGRVTFTSGFIENGSLWQAPSAASPSTRKIGFNLSGI